MNATGNKSIPLGREFFERETLTVARELLGKTLVRRIDGLLMSGRIVETEAYVGQDDLACHAARGRTARVEVMFGEAGRAYVYLIYGMYYCLNFVTEQEGYPAAVLIRALEPTEGIKTMSDNRGGRRGREIASGPGKLCQAMAIDRTLNGVDVCENQKLWVADGGGVPDDFVERSPRIGVDYAGACAMWPWRFTVAGNEFLSR